MSIEGAWCGDRVYVTQTLPRFVWHENEMAQFVLLVQRTFAAQVRQQSERIAYAAMMLTDDRYVHRIHWVVPPLHVEHYQHRAPILGDTAYTIEFQIPAIACQLPEYVDAVRTDRPG